MPLNGWYNRASTIALTQQFSTGDGECFDVWSDATYATIEQ
jgi:hypothetical protein